MKKSRYAKKRLFIYLIILTTLFASIFAFWKCGDFRVFICKVSNKNFCYRIPLYSGSYALSRQARERNLKRYSGDENNEGETK